MFICFLSVVFTLAWINVLVTVWLPPLDGSTTPYVQPSGSSRTPDATLNGYPAFLVTDWNESLGSTFHCIGENYKKRVGWKFRSCHYNLFCLDLEQHDFVIFRDSSDDNELLYNQENMDLSQTFPTTSIFGQQNNSVSIGGLNLNWESEMVRLRWAPRTISTPPPKSLYLLDPNVVLIPFHSLSASNPGHLVWDDFLPIFNLMQLFGLGQNHPLLLRYVLPDGPGLWASCDFTENHTRACQRMHNKFWPLMSPYHNQVKLTTNQDFEFHSISSDAGETTEAASRFVCARHGVAGIGALTDHGTAKRHGWEPWDYKSTHNHGRGGTFWRFRAFALQNIGLRDRPLTPPYKIVFSMHSSSIPNRNIPFQHHMDYLTTSLNPNDAVVEQYTFRKLSLREQIRVASEATVFVSGCGGGAVTATFVPRGAMVLLYYSSDGGVRNNERTFKPARLDWDLFNNLGYARAHWMPMNTMYSQEDMDALVWTIQAHIDRLKGGST